MPDWMFYVLASSAIFARAAQLALTEIDSGGDYSPWEDFDAADPNPPTETARAQPAIKAFVQDSADQEAIRADESDSSKAVLSRTAARVITKSTKTNAEADDWTIVLRYGNYAYVPTREAVGDVTQTDGFSKLSDDTINAIQGADEGIYDYKIESTRLDGEGTEHLFVRTSEQFDDTQPSFGFVAKHSTCEAKTIEGCEWVNVVSKPVSWSPSGNDCNHWFADTYEGDSSVLAWKCHRGEDEKQTELNRDLFHRCFSGGRECKEGYPMRKNVIISKLGKKVEPVPDPGESCDKSFCFNRKLQKSDANCCAPLNEASCSDARIVSFKTSCESAGSFSFCCIEWQNVMATAPEGIYTSPRSKWQKEKEPFQLWERLGAVSSLAVRGQTVFAAMAYTGIVWKTTDASGSWHAVSKPNVTSIALHGDTIYAARREDGAVVKQPLSSMTTSTNWVVAGATEVHSIAVSGDYIYGCAGDKVLRQTLSSMTPESDTASHTAWQEYAKGDCATVALDRDTLYTIGNDGKLYMQKMAAIKDTSDWAEVENSGLEQLQHSTGILINYVPRGYLAQKAAFSGGSIKMTEGIAKACPNGDCSGQLDFKMFCAASTQVSFEFEIMSSSPEDAAFQIKVGDYETRAGPTDASGKACTATTCTHFTINSWQWTDFTKDCQVSEGLATVRISNFNQGLQVRQARIVAGGDRCSLHHAPFTWQKVAYQSKMENFPATAKSSFTVDPGTPDSDTYMNFQDFSDGGQIGLKFDGKYRFKAAWDSDTVEWKQSSWITDGNSQPQGVECISPASCPDGFKGLGPSSGNFVFDGDGPGSNNLWTVGGTAVSSGIPGPSGKASSSVTLYVARTGQPLKGPPGPLGERGTTGQDGLPGDPGTDGAPGKDGQKGPQGPQGDPGDNGKVGDQGTEGPPDDSATDSLAGYGIYTLIVILWPVAWIILEVTLSKFLNEKLVKVPTETNEAEMVPVTEEHVEEEETHGAVEEEEEYVEEEVQQEQQEEELKPVKSSV